MAQKILITKAGKDITSTSPDDFYLNSDYPLLKVHDFGVITNELCTSDPDDTGLTITHSLGYKPYVQVFAQYADTDGFGGVVLSDEYYQLDWLQAGASVIFHGVCRVYNDRIEISVGNSDASSERWDGFYYIFSDEV